MNNAFLLGCGDSLELLKKLPDNSVDSVVTDPPYGLKFMGKKWDHSVPSVELWAECLRVLKPGGHLLAFAGTRTQHRMAVNIEDAGFEVRDMLAWVYGSGFPKSLDVSKAIDKIDRLGPMMERAYKFTAWMRSTGATASQINEWTGTFMGSHYLTDKSQPAVPTRELFELIRPHLGVEVPAFVEELIDSRKVEFENMKRREVVGVRKGNHLEVAPGQGRERPQAQLVDTASHTEDAKRWQGWGTALKPALEPITLARKPLAGTVAANVLAHGTGALNIDGARVEGKDGEPGRWPANLLHDGSEEVVDHLGHAGRFFYCAKASKRDRGEGNRHPTVKPTDLMRYLCRMVTPPGGVVLDPFMGSGSTGKAAVLEGFAFVGFDLEQDYVDLSRDRIVQALEDEGEPVFEFGASLEGSEFEELREFLSGFEGKT